jgi:O-antigen/teichoic acid export membrane protein
MALPEGSPQPSTAVEQEREIDVSLPPEEGDFAGRDRLARNVLAGWAAYFVIGVVGFLSPRVMDRRLGQEAVGIWDFGWSLVTYLGLTAFGVGSSVNRYVAHHRAAGDKDGLSRVVSTATVLNVMSGAAALLITGIFVWLVPRMLRGDQLAHVNEARLVVLFLGCTIAVSLSLGTYPAVLAGCHRFDISNAISAGFEVGSSVTIVLILLTGGGLVAAASVCFIGSLIAESTRFYWAHQVCPELSVRWNRAEWAEMKRLFRFGIKTTIGVLSGLLLLQANKLLVGGSLGLAALAVFSRPLALTRIVENFGTRLSNVLTPTASSLQRAGRHHELRQLVLDSTRLNVAVVLPMALTLALLGDPVMTLWMGPRYTPGAFLVVLVVGGTGPLALRPVRDHPAGPRSPRPPGPRHAGRRHHQRTAGSGQRLAPALGPAGRGVVDRPAHARIDVPPRLVCMPRLCISPVSTYGSRSGLRCCAWCRSDWCSPRVVSSSTTGPCWRSASACWWVRPC